MFSFVEKLLYIVRQLFRWSNMNATNIYDSRHIRFD